MKVRNGFVSNSSSSSFLISKRFITDEQMEKIRDIVYPDYSFWYISEDETYFAGRTDMDNFDMHDFMVSIGVDMEHVKWGW